MREIKFRIWDIEDKRWTVYEDVVWLQLAGRNRLKLKTKKGIACEYTGLKDKHNVEVYEGDIVKTRHGKKYQVYFDDGCFKMHTWAISVGDFEPMEVIGNIYENSELLKCDK